MILRPHAPKARALPTELHPDISVTTGSRTQMVSLPSELKSDASRQFRHSDISLSVQQSTVFPICQYSSTYPSSNGLVALLRFELRILQGLSLLRMPNSAIGPYRRSFPAVSPAQGIFGGRKCLNYSLPSVSAISLKSFHLILTITRLPLRSFNSTFGRPTRPSI